MNRLFLLLFGAVSLVAHAQVPDYVPTDGLVAWYPFNGNANDESGNGNDGVAENVTLEFDRFGNPNAAFGFQGQNCCGQPDELVQQVVIENPIANLGEDYTVSTWFLSADLEKYQQCLFNSIPHAGFAVEYNNEHATDVICVGLGPGNANWNTLYQHGPFADYNQDQWYHVLFVKQNSQFRLYINGNLDWESTYAFAEGYNLDVGIRFGSIGSGHEILNGSLDDCGIWNRALTEEEIQVVFEGIETQIISGCTDESACNFNPLATEDDGSCEFVPDWTYEDAFSVCLGEAFHFPQTLDPCIENLGTPNNWPWPPFEEIGAIPLGNFGTPTVFSLSFSVNPSDNLPGIRVLFDASHGGSSNWVLQKLNGQWHFLNATLPLVDNEWQDVLIQYDNCHVSVYIDAVLVDETDWCINYNGSPQWYLGNWPEGGRRFQGLVDDVLLTHSILSWEDRQLGAAAPNAAQFFSFDEGEGEISQDQVTGDEVNLYQWQWSGNGSYEGTVVWPGFENSAFFYPTDDTLLSYQWTGGQCALEDSILIYVVEGGCADEGACNFDASASCLTDCIYPVLGALDCDEGAQICGVGTVWNAQNQTCDPLPSETTSDSNACGPGTYWNELESLCLPMTTCQDDLDGDGVIGVNDLMQLLSSFGTDCAPTEEPETTEFTCGDPVNYHGYDYATVQIGEQCWFAENLRTELYQNEDAIPLVVNDIDWDNIDGYAFLISIAPVTIAKGLEEYTDTIENAFIDDMQHKSLLLELKFTDGSTYEYFGVNKNLFTKLVNADKVQRFARRNIFNSFTYRKSKKTIEAE